MSAAASPPTVVSLHWQSVPALDKELEQIVFAMAGAAKDLWPRWYSTVDERFDRERWPNAEVACRLDEARKAAPAVSAAWFRKAWAACQRGKAPIVRPMASAEHVRQLAIVLEPRAPVFSERITTLEHLRDAIAERFGIEQPDEGIHVFEASQSDADLNRIKKSFGQEASPVRLLLASDAASEGVNLHYHCHQLFHFDIPWSLIRLTQRNGRIDRYGQKQVPHLHYLLMKSDEVAADQQIISRLIERETVVHRQLADAGALLGLYDAEAEDNYITDEVAKGRRIEETLPDEPRAPMVDEAAPAQAVDESDLFALLSEPDEPGVTPAAAPMHLDSLLSSAARAGNVRGSIDEMVTNVPSLFASDHELCVTALRHLEDRGGVSPPVPPEVVAQVPSNLRPWPDVGRGHDLTALFQLVTARPGHFPAGPPIVRDILYMARVRRDAYGFHRYSDGKIFINPILNSPDVPQFVMEFLIYHEVLHADLPSAGHDRNFRERERRFRPSESAAEAAREIGYAPPDTPEGWRLLADQFLDTLRLPGASARGRM